MTKSEQDITALYEAIRPQWQAPHVRMADMVKALQDETELPGPEMPGWEEVSTPNLAKQAALNIMWDLSSSFPDITVPPQRPNIDASMEKARKARLLLLFWAEQNRMADLIMPERALHLPSLGMSPVVVLPDKKLGHSRWETRDPQTAYFPPMGDSVGIVPPWGIFRTSHRYGELRTLYGDSLTALDLGGREVKDSLLIDCLEYIDDTERVFMALGKKDPYRPSESLGTKPALILDRAEHFTGCTPIANPMIPMFHKIMGAFDSAIDGQRQRALLLSLATLGAKRSIFATPWLQGDGPTEPEIVRIPSRDGLTPGIVRGGQLEWNRPDAAAVQIIMPLLSLLERNDRVDIGVPASMGGENPVGSRTGANVQELTTAAVSGLRGRIHILLALSLREEFRFAIRQALAAFPDTEQNYMLNGKRAKGIGKAKAKDVFEHETVLVEYPHAGLTPQQWAVEGLQRVGAGLMSPRTFMEKDPRIDDVEQEQDRIIAYRLLNATLSAVEQQAASGAIPANFMGEMAQLVVTNQKDVFAAIDAVHKKMQELQSTTVNPAQPGSPEAQPGLAQPGTGAEAGVIPTQTGNDTADLATLVRQLRTTSRSPVPQ